LQVDIEGKYITEAEIRNLNINNVLDSNGLPLPKMKVNRVNIYFKRGTDSSWVSVGSDNWYSPGFDIDKYDSFVNLMLPKLTLGDSIRFYFEYEEVNEVVRNAGRPMRMNIWFSSAQSHIISTQNVADLSRDPHGNALVTFPSPAAEYVSVKCNIKEPTPAKLRLFSSLGKELVSAEHQNMMQPYTFRIEEYPAGTYFMSITIDGETFIRKVVKY
jgi:hypothetical protein